MTRLTRLMGMLKATPLLLPVCEAMAVLMPMTSPSRLMSGPPLEPGLMAASVCKKSLMRMVLPRLTWPRSRALMMPCVTVWFRPNGLPMASTHWPDAHVVAVAQRRRSADRSHPDA